MGEERSGGDDQPSLAAEFDLFGFILLFLMSQAFCNLNQTNFHK